jgi:DNA-binding response OmpR family regulator
MTDLRPGHTPRPGKIRASPDPESSMPATILVADDSLAIQRVVTLVFEDSGYELELVGNGEEALAAARATMPAMVIADIHMPGATGYDVARGVKGASPGTPVLLLVGTFEPFDEREVAACGADGYLMKPFEGLELRRRVEALLGPRPAAEAEPEPPAPGEEAAPTAAGIEKAPAAESAGETDGGSPAPGRASPPAVAASPLSGDEIERVARRVVELMSDEVVRRLADEIVPRVAERVVTERIAELERDLPD